MSSPPLFIPHTISHSLQMASSVDSVLNGTDLAETGRTGATSLAPDALSIRDIIARMNESLNVVYVCFHKRISRANLSLHFRSGTLDSLNEYSTLVTAAAPAMVRHCAFMRLVCVDGVSVNSTLAAALTARPKASDSDASKADSRRGEETERSH